MTVRVRIAPSPTGNPHVGTAYIALFNYAFAKQRGGQFVLRIEDTDQARCTPASEAAILDALAWLGIGWDEGPDKGGPHGPYRQSERLPIYRKYVEELVAKGKAYWCDCSPETLAAKRKEMEAKKQTPMYDGHCRERALSSGAVVRMKVPREEGAQTVVNNLFRGPTTFKHKENVDDQVLMKSDGFPTYHLAVVVDDHLMEITHVFRGEEWLTSTPKHLLLYEAFGWKPTEFAHMPLLRNAGGTKISKRKNPVSLSWYRECGYLPDVMINFLGRMAHTFADGREVFSLQDFVENFDVKRVHLGGPVFDMKMLLDLNGRYLREKRSDAEVARYLSERLFNDAYLEKIVTLMKTRFEKSEDFVEQTAYFFAGSVQCDTKDLVVKDKTPKESAELLGELVEKIDVLFDWRTETVTSLLATFAEEKQLGPHDLSGPLRWAMTGRKSSPPIQDVIAILGRERVRTRIRAILDPLKKLAAPAPAKQGDAVVVNPPTEKAADKGK